MNLLLDTHVAIWAIRASQRLPPRIRQLILDPDNAVFVSVVCIWEIAIKRALRRPAAPGISAGEAIGQLEAAGYQWLHVEARHAAAVESLPLIHGDPFDRMVVAQSLVENMRLVSADSQLAAYGDTVITW